MTARTKTCLYCRGPIPLFRRLKRADYCSAFHHRLYNTRLRAGQPGSGPFVIDISYGSPQAAPKYRTPRVRIIVRVPKYLLPHFRVVLKLPPALQHYLIEAGSSRQPGLLARLGLLPMVVRKQSVLRAPQTQTATAGR